MATRRIPITIQGQAIAAAAALAGSIVGGLLTGFITLQGIDRTIAAQAAEAHEERLRIAAADFIDAGSEAFSELRAYGLETKQSLARDIEALTAVQEALDDATTSSVAVLVLEPDLRPEVERVLDGLKGRSGSSSSRTTRTSPTTASEQAIGNASAPASVSCWLPSP